MFRAGGGAGGAAPPELERASRGRDQARQAERARARCRRTQGAEEVEVVVVVVLGNRDRIRPGRRIATGAAIRERLPTGITLPGRALRAVQGRFGPRRYGPSRTGPVRAGRAGSSAAMPRLSSSRGDSRPSAGRRARAPPRRARSSCAARGRGSAREVV